MKALVGSAARVRRNKDDAGPGRGNKDDAGPGRGNKNDAGPGRGNKNDNAGPCRSNKNDAAPRPVFSWPMRVYFQHTDAGGMVFHGHYFGFMECARTELLQSLGFDLAELARRDKVLFVVHSAQIAYHRPALLNDALRVTARVTAIGRARMVFEQQVRRDNDLLASAELTLACVDALHYKPIALPGAIRKKLEGTA